MSTSSTGETTMSEQPAQSPQPAAAEPAEVGPVVVGFDGSATGEDGLALARWCGRVLDAPIIVAVVHPEPAPVGIGRVDAEWVADRHRLAEQVLGDARKLMSPAGARVEYRILRSSSAAHGLHDLAEEVGAEIIVVGSRSTGPEERLFAGSTADRLLSGSVCPIAVAPSGMRNRPAGTPEPPLTRIGVAYVDTPEARAALDLAVRLARRTSASLRLYTVIAGESEVMPIGIGHDAEHTFTSTVREAFQLALDTALSGLPSGTDAEGHLLTGNVVDVLTELDENDVDVLFCGSRGYGPVRRVLLGGVSSRLVRRARSPLIVVPRA
jgi:nucleotide-binding universal stress UspA family protein